MANKVASLAAIDLPSLSVGIDAGVSLAVDVDTTLNDPDTGVDVCLLDAVNLAFSAAAATPPPLPSPPAIPDMSASASAAADISANVAGILDPLGIFGAAVTFTFDASGLPTLIEWDDGLP
jgi:hypothetical protein